MVITFEYEDELSWLVRSTTLRCCLFCCAQVLPTFPDNLFFKCDNEIY